MLVPEVIWVRVAIPNDCSVPPALVRRAGFRHRIAPRRLLHAGHHKVAPSTEELSRIGAWVDCNAIFYGGYDPKKQAKQLKGEAGAMPEVQ